MTVHIIKFHYHNLKSILKKPFSWICLSKTIIFTYIWGVPSDKISRNSSSIRWKSSVVLSFRIIWSEDYFSLISIMKAIILWIQVAPSWWSPTEIMSHESIPHEEFGSEDSLGHSEFNFQQSQRWVFFSF